MNKLKTLTIFIILLLSLNGFCILGDIGGYSINVDSPVVDPNLADFLSIEYRVFNYGFIFQQDSLKGDIFGATLKSDFGFNHSHPSLIALYYPFKIKKEKYALYFIKRLIGTSYLDLKQDDANLYLYDYPKTLEMKLDLKMQRDEITDAYGLGFGRVFKDVLGVAFLVEYLTTESNRLFVGYAIDTNQNYEYEYINKAYLEATAFIYSIYLSYQFDETLKGGLIISKVENMKIHIDKELSGEYTPELPPIMSSFQLTAEDDYSLNYPVRFKLALSKKLKASSLKFEMEIIPRYENSGVLFKNNPSLKSKYHEVRNIVIAPRIDYTRSILKNGNFKIDFGSYISYRNANNPKPDEYNGLSFSDEFISNSDLSVEFFKIGADVGILYKMFYLKMGILNVYGTGLFRAYDIQSNKTVITDISTNSYVLVLNLSTFF